LLFLRLVPIFPFWLVNLVPALCGVPLATFVAATALGIIPVTFAFAFVGAGLDSVIAAQQAAYQSCLAAGGPDCRLEFHMKAALTPELLGAFVALGVLALIPVGVERLRARPTAHARGGAENAGFGALGGLLSWVFRAFPGEGMAERLQPDICVIGAGSGGLSVAAAAAAFGVPVVLVEKNKMGGECLNTGCVPSKSLIAAAKHARAVAQARVFGVAAGAADVD